MPPPVMRTPITDMIPAGYSHQTFGRCMKLEDQYLQCCEAYGSRLSDTKCELYKNDLKECNTLEKQMKRVELMQKERERQIKAGLRPEGKEYQVAPEIHSWGGTFFGTHY